MTSYFISRHQGARDWAKQEGIDAKFVEHLDVAAIAGGDHVYGTLPVSMAQKICAKGARYFHLEIPLSRADRNRELTADEMKTRGAKFTELYVKKPHVPVMDENEDADNSGQTIAQNGPRIYANRRKIRKALSAIFTVMVIGLMVFCAEQVLEAFVIEKSFNSPYFFGFVVLAAILVLIYINFSQNPSQILGTSVRTSSVDSERGRKYFLSGYSPIRSEQMQAALELSKQPNGFDIIAMATKDYEAAGHPYIGSWQQTARALYPHKDYIKAIYILRPNMKDAEFEQFKLFLENCLKTNGTVGVSIRHIHFRKKPDMQFVIQARSEQTIPPSFEDFEYVYEGLRVGLNLIKSRFKKDLKPEDVIIDITPGFKPYSVAAATLTLNENIKYSYVANNGSVLFYDADIRIAG